eukprot:m51a1_g4789 putative domain containing protein (674) ;mRNA; f:68346-71036
MDPSAGLRDLLARAEVEHSALVARRDALTARLEALDALLADLRAAVARLPAPGTAAASPPWEHCSPVAPRAAPAELATGRVPGPGNAVRVEEMLLGAPLVPPKPPAAVDPQSSESEEEDDEEEEDEGGKRSNTTGSRTKDKVFKSPQAPRRHGAAMTGSAVDIPPPPLVDIPPPPLVDIPPPGPVDIPPPPLKDKQADLSSTYRTQMRITARYADPRMRRSTMFYATPEGRAPEDDNPAPFIPVFTQIEQPPAQVVQAVRAQTVATPYPFGDKDAEENIVMSPQREIVAVTLPKLVEKMTAPTPTNPALAKTFLFSYRAFASATDVYDLLVRRFHTPADAAPEDQRDAIKAKTLKFLAEWAASHWYDWEDNGDLLLQMSEFCVEQMRSDSSAVCEAARQLLKIVHAKGEVEPAHVVPLGPPPRVVSVPSRINSVLDVNHVELARQLSLMEFELFKRIKPNESHRSDRAKASNLFLFIERLNGIGRWVVGLVLKERNRGTRRMIIKKVLAIADACKTIQNYSTMMELVATLASAPVSYNRLRRSWSPKLIAKQLELESVMDRNFRQLRGLVNRAAPPCIPYIGLYFTDLVSIAEGNPTFVPGTENRPAPMINWGKMQLTARIVAQIRHFQSTPYNFTPCPHVQQFVQAGVETSDFTDEQAYKLSLRLEPPVGRQ